MRRSQSQAIVAKLKAAFPHGEVTQATVDTYVEFMLDLDPQEARTAVDYLIKSATFFPRIAEIRRQVAEQRLKLPTPEDAWVEVQREIRRVGEHGKPRWSHPAIGEATTAISLWEMRYTDKPEQIRRAFMQVYPGIRERVISQATISPQERPQLPDPQRQPKALEKGEQS